MAKRYPKDHIVKLYHNGGKPFVGSPTGNKPLRNDPCPCGKGKKFKNCCMQKSIVDASTGKTYQIRSEK